jgi:hypothetical protein
LGRGGEGNVLGLGSRKCNVVLQLTGPRNRATPYHRNEVGTRATVNPITKGGVLPNKESGRDGAGKSKAKIHCAREIAKNTFCLFPITSSRRRHMTVEEANSNKDVGAGLVGTVE